MRLLLQNVGKIEKADVELQGITVIAGENNSGKSILGKMLYCIFDAFYMLPQQVYEERCKEVRRLIRNCCMEVYGKPCRRTFLDEIIADLVKGKEKFLGDSRLIEKELTEYFRKTFGETDDDSFADAIENASVKIWEILGISDESIEAALLEDRLRAEFGMKIGHLNEPENKSEVELQIKNRRIKFSVSGNQTLQIAEKMNLVKEICYLDDPFVLDELWEMSPFIISDPDHRTNLREKLCRKGADSSVGTLYNLNVERKLNKIFAVMQGICDGELQRAENGRDFVYRTDKLRGELELSNLSTGLKSFLILRTLLKNGSIDANGMIIMDEPEIHLHPEWQLCFAEIIVLIQKEFGANILLNTHSPYFLNAIEVYSVRHEIAENCRYYLTEEQNGKTTVKDVTGQTEYIYKKLARPLQKLENL